MVSAADEARLQKFKEAVEELKRNAETLTGMLVNQQPTVTSVAQQEPPVPTLTHLERARVLLALCQTMHALHQMHMRSCGLDPQKHFETDIHKVRTRAGQAHK